MIRIPVVEHLPADEIARRYRACADAAEKTRWQVLWLVTRPDAPLSAGKAAAAVGLTPSWGRTLLHRWNEHGPGGLADGRRNNGAEPLLTPDRQAELDRALQSRLTWPADHPDTVKGAVGFHCSHSALVTRPRRESPNTVKGAVGFHWAVALG